ATGVVILLALGIVFSWVDGGRTPVRRDYKRNTVNKEVTSKRRCPLSGSAAGATPADAPIAGVRSARGSSPAPARMRARRRRPSRWRWSRPRAPRRELPLLPIPRPAGPVAPWLPCLRDPSPVGVAADGDSARWGIAGGSLGLDREEG